MALAAGRIVVSEDNSVVVDSPLDVIVEATGHPEGGAINAERALRQRRHVVLVSKEVDSAVGPYLARLARDNGVVCSPVEGDQPALLMGLVSWAQALGLEIVALGKSSEYDYVFDPARAQVTWRTQTIDTPWIGGLWPLDMRDPARTLAARSLAIAALPQRTVPDYCEMCLVANATGFRPDTPRLHAPLARSVELPTILRLRERGGVLAAKGAIEVFNCLRRTDEASF
ncbi:MAG: flagellar biosynthesis protein FlgA, partial [Alphaproteobacteria bacterium]|nr:flagellar biosynthesis protein FlgA [Alphaproteobacteria bacterium]